ncbi:phosphodiester glycosidase family protein [Streptomyces cocklensis]|uniref:3\',5\'-cyclic AMP phosphodiesterase CpdA n=1 Tax=Actinacidiphila cocklensis TaxID=887465 RepID=A0A9W4DU21_9ACTN|nr:phosphodiester glycosidase family protein [Actinacidiphila cocklensis]MDD1056809.1 phosphodiester glycosidase family protein [Actinacidiphila cocklensis]CAG6397709.1 3\\',5\\'-cyclic AMP phosphodiesterase CpdA [Actinacidiphila cocklensis]
MDMKHSGRAEITRRGLIVGAVAAAGVAAAGGTAAAAEGEQGAVKGGGGDGGPVGGAQGAFRPPVYRLAVDGESVVSSRVDHPVAPGIALTSFDVFGRTGWLRAHVLNADLGDSSVSVDLVADKVSDPRPLKGATDGQHAVAAVNGDYFDITETFAAEGPEIQGGQLRKGTDRASTVVAFGADRVARLADLVIAGTVAVAGTAMPLAALNSASTPADGVAVFTPLWGNADRTLLLDPGPYTELVVSGGLVTVVNSAITATPVPADGLVVLGRGAAAGRLAGTRVGDAVSVDFAPQSDAPGALRMALGSGSVLVRGGTPVDFPPSTGNDAPKPRTAVGWPAGGHRLLLVAVDGGGNFSTGLSFDDMARLMARLGADEAFMLDGGGSTEIVARRPGDTGVGVVNTPSDGAERPVPNGVGLFGRRGSGQLRGLDVRPQADRVVPGLTVDVSVAGYDEAWGPAATAGHQVGWAAEPGSLGKVSDGVFRARRSGAGVLRAHAGGADGEYGLRVLGELHRLAFTQRAVTLDPGAALSVGLVGYDADGFDAPVAPRDVTLDYDRSVITVAATGGALTITGAADAGGRSAALTATVQGVTVRLPVSVGLVDVSLGEFEPGETWTALAARGTASVAVVDAPDRPGAAAGNHALRLTYDFTGQPSTSAAYVVASPAPITLPVGTRKLALWVNGDGKGHWLRAMLSSQGTTNVPFTFATVVDWTGWRRVVGDIPAGFSDPVTLSRLYIAETSQTNKNAGQLDFDGLAAQVGQQPDQAEPPMPDPYVVEQGELPDRRWTFAVLSDLHISAAAGLDSFSGRQAVAALGQVVAARPDFILINGDFVDNNNPADFDLADGLLRDHVPAGLPVYWTPGNHEAGLSATGGLDTFLAVTGRPNKQVLDHKGTRFILLDSHTGDMRTSDWDQVPLLQAELAKAAGDRSVTGVVVSFHHPLHDPSGAAASQLSDQLEAGLLQRWLADFREQSGKPVALFTGHAHTASVTRTDGVLDVTTPAVGKTPYSSPDQGGFFGWMHVSVDPRPARIRAGRPSPETREWLQAESRPLIDRIDLTAPGSLAVGASGTVEATGVTSEFGLRFPLRFPASVTWSGSRGLTVAATAAAASAARRHPSTLAVLDLSTATLTAVRPGRVTVTVATGGLTSSADVDLG